VDSAWLSTPVPPLVQIEFHSVEFHSVEFHSVEFLSVEFLRVEFLSVEFHNVVVPWWWGAAWSRAGPVGIVGIGVIVGPASTSGGRR
jgi:hypothetical protein